MLNINNQLLAGLVVLLVMSVAFNIYQFIQLKRYQLHNRTKTSWHEAMNLGNPISLFLWWGLCSGAVLGILVGIIELFI